MKIKTEKLIFLLLIIAIFIGVFFRIYNLNYPFFPGDDAIFAVASLKIHHQSFRDGVMYVWNHPPLGKYITGIFTIFLNDPSFEILKSLPPQSFGYAHLAAVPLKKTIKLLRYSSLLFGILTIFFVFLITKKIYSKNAAIWVAALFSLSLDFIGFSRNLYPENLMVFFMVAGLYFYIEYVYFNKNKFNLFMLFLSLLFLLNSRQFQPVIIGGIFFLHYALINYLKTKNFERTIDRSLDLIILYIAIAALTLLFIYKPLPPSEFTGSSLLNYGFQLHRILAVLIFRNSYLSLFGLILLFNYSYKNLGYLKKIKKTPEIISSKKMIIPYFFILSILSMLFFDFPYWSIFRYLSFISALAIVLEGISINEFLKDKKGWKIILIIFILILTFYQIYNASLDHPPFILNSNFNIGTHALLPDTYVEYYNHSVYEKLREMGNPTIMTNLVWLITYYDGQAIPPPLEGTKYCSKEFFNVLKKKGAILVVRDPDFFEREPWASCNSFRNLNFTKVDEIVLKNAYSKKENHLGFFKIA